MSVANNCNLCGRKLDNIDDPLSTNCGGDCWGCIGEIEFSFDSDNYYQAEITKQIEEEIKLGLRKADGSCVSKFSS